MPAREDVDCDPQFADAAPSGDVKLEGECAAPSNPSDSCCICGRKDAGEEEEVGGAAWDRLAA